MLHPSILRKGIRYLQFCCHGGQSTILEPRRESTDNNEVGQVGSGSPIATPWRKFMQCLMEILIKVGVVWFQLHNVTQDRSSIDIVSLDVMKHTQSHVGPMHSAIDILLQRLVPALVVNLRANDKAQVLAFHNNGNVPPCWAKFSDQVANG